MNAEVFMQFIITNGTSYCHRSNRQAVSIVDTADAATKFADREAAEKLLLRATKKLKGFYVEQVSGAEKSPEKGTTKKEKTEKQTQKKTEKQTPAKQTAKKGCQHFHR